MLVCAGMCLTFHPPVLAGGPGTANSNGKVPSRARFVLDNNTDEDLLIWIRPEGTPLPATVSELNEMLIAITPFRQNRGTGRLRNGIFTIDVFFASDVASEIDSVLDQGLFDAGSLDQITAVLNGFDVDVEIDDTPSSLPTLSLP